MQMLKVVLLGLVIFGCAVARADVVNSYSLILDMDGSTAINAHGGGPNVPAQASDTACRAA